MTLYLVLLIWPFILFCFSMCNLALCRGAGQGELTHTLILTVKTQLLKIVYFWKFDTKFSFKVLN
jgi:hypothetical protein